LGLLRRAEHGQCLQAQQLPSSQGMEGVPDIWSSAEPGGGHGRSEEAILQEWVQSLNEADRGVFLLYLSNLTYRGMAEITAIQEPTLRVKINRLKARYGQRYIGS
jgi:DNA-directed RNA polymerase specialized sigma24 family protein